MRPQSIHRFSIDLHLSRRNIGSFWKAREWPMQDDIGIVQIDFATKN